jgi:hypothetical protein
MKDLHQVAAKIFGDQHRAEGVVLDDDPEQFDLRATQRRELGRYTLEEAAVFVAIKGRARPRVILRAMMDSIAAGVLKSYLPGENGVYRDCIVRPWSDEVFGSDMDAWLIQYEPRIGPQFPISPSPEKVGTKATSVTNTQQSNSTKQDRRPRNIDDALDKAIENAGNFNQASVRNALCDLLEKGPLTPFIYPLVNRCVMYLDDNGNTVELTKESLTKRLAWRKKRAAKRDA